MRLMTALALLATPVAAQDAWHPDGCFARTYDASHLMAHPEQVVAKLAVLFDAASGTARLRLVPATGGYAGGALGGGMSCETSKAGVVCHADCDGGTMRVEAVAGSLLLRTERFWTGQANGCDGVLNLAEVEGQTTTYELHPAPDATCEGF